MSHSVGSVRDRLAGLALGAAPGRGCAVTALPVGIGVGGSDQKAPVVVTPKRGRRWDRRLSWAFLVAIVYQANLLLVGALVILSDRRGIDNWSYLRTAIGFVPFLLFPGCVLTRRLFERLTTHAK